MDIHTEQSKPVRQKGAVLEDECMGLQDIAFNTAFFVNTKPTVVHLCMV